MKKIPAKKLKEQIISHYKTITLNFNKDDDNDDNNKEAELQSNEKDVCSICSNSNKNEILSYPLYIYRTKYPFIFDKPPLVSMPIRIVMKETEIYQDEEIMFNNEEEDNDDDDDENIPDQEDVFARIIGQIPDLDITDGMDEAEIERRRTMLDLLYKRIVDQYNLAKQEPEKTKKLKEQEKMLRIQRAKEEALKREKELENPDLIVQKQIASGNLFVIQFGICQNLVHPNCVKGDNFSCPIDHIKTVFYRILKIYQKIKFLLIK